MLGCGALMTSLRRLAVGPFVLEHAILFDGLDASRLSLAIQPPLQAIAELPRRVVDGDEIKVLRQGRTIAIGVLSSADTGTEVALIDINQTLIGVARFEAETQRLQPHIVFAT